MLKAAQWTGAGGVALHPNKPNLAPIARCEIQHRPGVQRGHHLVQL